MADMEEFGEQRASTPRTSGDHQQHQPQQQQQQSPPAIAVVPSSPLSPTPSHLSGDESMPATRSSARPTGASPAKGTGRSTGTRSSGRLGPPPAKLRRIVTPDDDEDMESEDDAPVTAPGGEDDSRMDDATGDGKPVQSTSTVVDEDAEGEPDEDAAGEDDPAALGDELEDLTPPPPSPLPTPPKPAPKPNLRIKVKFEGKRPVKARPATARSARGKGKLPFSSKNNDDAESEDSPPTPKAHTRATRAHQVVAASSTPALSATPGQSVDTTPAPLDDEEVSPPPEDFDEMEDEDLGLSRRRRSEKMDVDDEEEEEEQDELEDEQVEPDEEEEEEEEEEAAEDEAAEAVDDEDEEEDEEMSVPPSGRMTARQAAMKGSGATVEFIELPTGPGKKKHLTPQEIELRKQEQSRKRSLQSAQKLEEEKQATIRRLLAKQAPKTRSSRSGVSSTTAPGSSGDGSATPQLAPVPTLARWVSTKDGLRWAVPPEGKWLAYVGPVKRALPERMKEIKGEDDIEMEDDAKDAQPTETENKPEPPPPPRARTQAVCAIEGCGQLRKYRSVKDFEKGACGLEHLKVLNAMLA